MKTYRISFYGRKLGAIGVCYGMVKVVQAASPEDALKVLYEDYEHVAIYDITEVK